DNQPQAFRLGASHRLLARQRIGPVLCGGAVLRIRRRSRQLSHRRPYRACRPTRHRHAQRRDQQGRQARARRSAVHRGCGRQRHVRGGGSQAGRDARQQPPGEELRQHAGGAPHPGQRRADQDRQRQAGGTVGGAAQGPAHGHRAAGREEGRRIRPRVRPQRRHQGARKGHQAVREGQQGGQGPGDQGVRHQDPAPAQGAPGPGAEAAAGRQGRQGRRIPDGRQRRKHRQHARRRQHPHRRRQRPQQVGQL
ncbi:MAG: hypothetical protein AVDCRST_MAG51-1456, partial [uncultured Ramlibacter sp.]